MTRKMTTQELILRANSNIKGGGLAKNITGKQESNRNAIARLDPQKRSAGEVAMSLGRKGYSGVKTKDIKLLCEEWHHSGCNGAKMRRKYYTTKTDKEVIKGLRNKNRIFIAKIVSYVLERTNQSERPIDVIVNEIISDSSINRLG